MQEFNWENCRYKLDNDFCLIGIIDGAEGIKSIIATEEDISKIILASTRKVTKARLSKYGDLPLVITVQITEKNMISQLDNGQKNQKTKELPT